MNHSEDTNFGDFIEDKSAENPSDMTSYALLKDKLAQPPISLQAPAGAGTAPGPGGMLRLVSRIVVEDASGSRHALELLVGDITHAAPEAPVDLLAISAFPDAYNPSRGTVIRSLSERGVSVSRLAESKARDWRAGWQCWISDDFTAAGLGISRLLCFEHHGIDEPENLVGNVFRSASEWLLLARAQGPSKGTMRIPLLATGLQGHDPCVMLRAIVRQAHLHLLAGLPVAKLQVVLHEFNPDLLRLCVAFGELMEEIKHSAFHVPQRPTDPESDLFISYRHSDLATTDSLVESLRRLKSGLRIWIDREKLSTGCFWKPELLRAIGGARHGLCVVTDSYPDSPECMDEFHAALCCERIRRGYLLPILALDQRPVSSLPQSMRQVQFLGDRGIERNLGVLADRIVSAIARGQVRR